MKRDEMTCTGVREQFALLLYGELDFDQEARTDSHLDVCGECRDVLAKEKAMHAALDSIEVHPSPSLLHECREDLTALLMEEMARPVVAARRGTGTGWWDSFVDTITLRTSSGYLRPVGALTL